MRRGRGVVGVVTGRVALANAARYADQVLADRERAAHDQEDRNVRLGGTLVYVEGADDHHGHGDDDGDGASDCAAEGADQQDQHFDGEVKKIAGRLARVSNAAEERVV